MEELKEGIDFRMRKVSMLSLDKEGREVEKTAPVPEDKFYLVHIVFFFFGLGGIMPGVFFMTANDYWMYKFKDPSQENYDSHNRTNLQANFVAISSMTHSIPNLITTMILTFYGHKIHIRIRFLAPLFFIVATYITFTALVEINTDSWQFAFFILTIVVSTLITVLQIVFQFSNLALISRFPNAYIKSQMYGTSSTGVVSAIIQIICLAVGGTPIQAALLYFLTGTSVLIITLILACVSKYLPFFQHYLGDVEADIKRPIYSLVEMKDVAIKIWPLMAIMMVAIGTMCMSHQTITILVVSEGYGHGNQWNDKYFVPVVTFLLSDVMALVARFFAIPLFTKKNAKWFAIFEVVRTLCMAPLFLFCNALPRKHLPVWFPHDWEYAILISLLQLCRAFMSTSSSLSMRVLLGDKAELGFLIMQTTGGIVGSIFSLLNTVFVNIL
ncbi:hypothetical protein JTB14_031335 [Gonioctena quinquepunctata]|nr:hypothetical protein JTB14_031335 [Gonioctena quinquepunctata]